MKIVELTSQNKRKIATDFLSDDLPYFAPISPDKVVSSMVFDRVAQRIEPGKSELDVSSLISFLHLNYICGNGTFATGLYKMPLHALLDFRGEPEFSSNIPHQNDPLKPDEFYDRLIALLKQELNQFIGDNTEVFLTLSGGLDSRVSAGILQMIQQDRPNLTVVAVTWGNAESRDSVYAKRICDLFNWELVHLDIYPEILTDNLKIAVECLGAEVSAVHLHAMKDFEKTIPRGGKIIASSYGDSIGRGEFSGKFIKNIHSTPLPQNTHGLFYPDVFQSNLAETTRCYTFFTDQQKVKSRYEKVEIFYQENYMRRMIDAVFRYLSSFYSLHQTFTSPEVVKLVWRLSDQSRDSRIYKNLLPKINLDLAKMPWARNLQNVYGELFLQDTAIPKDYHSYCLWTRTRYEDFITSQLFSNSSGLFEVINEKYLKSLWRSFVKGYHDDYEIFWKLLGVKKVIEKYDLRVQKNQSYQSDYSKFWWAKNKLIAKKVVKKVLRK